MENARFGLKRVGYPCDFTLIFLILLRLYVNYRALECAKYARKVRFFASAKSCVALPVGDSIPDVFHYALRTRNSTQMLFLSCGSTYSAGACG
jgi:hypothetical protein